MTEQEQRRAVVMEALSWKQTRFVHGQCVKHIACDCARFVAAVFENAGILHDLDVPSIPSQWFLNGREELYLNHLKPYAAEYEFTPGTGMPEPKSGDILLIKHRWVYSHSAIVLEWPRVIHCHPPMVMESEVFENPVFRGRPIKYFNPWAQENNGL